MTISSRQGGSLKQLNVGKGGADWRKIHRFARRANQSEASDGGKKIVFRSFWQLLIRPGQTLYNAFFELIQA